MPNSSPDPGGPSGDTPEVLPEGGRRATRRRGRARGCLKWLAVFLVIAVPPGLWLLNGPVFRRAAAWGIGKAASTRGLEGRATVTGTLLAGFGLKDLRFEGGGTVRSILLEDSEVDYRIADLIADRGGLGWLEKVRFENASVELVLPEASEDAEEDASGNDESAPGLEKLWDFLGTRFEFRNISLRIAIGAEKVYAVDEMTFELASDGEGELSIAALSLPGQETRRDIRTGIRLTPATVTLGPLAVFPELELTSLTFHRAGGAEPLLSATLALAGGVVEGTFDSGNRISAKLTSGKIDVPRLLAIAGIDDLESATIRALDLTFAGEIAAPQSWDAAIDSEIAEVSWKNAGIDSVTLAGRVAPGGDDRLRATVTRAGASVQADAALDLAGVTAPADLANLPATVKLIVNVPAAGALIADFIPEGAAKLPVTGAFGGTATVQVAGKKLVSAEADLGSDTLAFHDVAVETLKLNATTSDDLVIALTARARLGGEASLDLEGKFDPDAMTYDAKADLRVEPADKLRQLLAALGIEKEFAGSATVSWRGSGDLKDKAHRGEGEIDAAGVRLGEATPFSAVLSAKYDGFDDVAVPRFSIDSEPFQFEGALTWQDGVLDVTRLEARGDGKPLLAGHIRTPLDLAKVKSAGDYFRQEGALDIEIKSEELPLATVMGLFREEPPASCRVSVDLKVSGSPQQPEADGSVVVSGLVLKGAEKVPPAGVALEFGAREEMVKVIGEFTHPQINPFQIEASLPFRPVDWVDGKSDLLDEPLEARASMAESSLAFLTEYAPEIESLTGAIGVNARVGGSLREPKVNGAASASVSELRLVNPSAPSVRNLEVLLLFEDRQLRIEKLSGLVAGGRLGIGGTIGFPVAADGEERSGPVFDLKVDGDEVLIARDENLSLRTNLDLALTGEWKSARLSGRIGITSSRFFKDIDLLPAYRETGRGKSEIPEVEPGPAMPLPKKLEIGVAVEPFANWTSDVEVVTLDPFVVGGNRMRARVRSDLRITGTFGAPAPLGKVWMEEGMVRLPFSRVEIDEAAVVFDERTGFNGRLGVKATSTVGDYRVTIYGSNRVLDPGIILSSVPPLPREDILTLIGTGTTRSGLTATGGNTAAVKSMMLLLRGAASELSPVDPEAEPGFFETISERSKIEIGAVDPETGYRSNGGSFRMWRDFWVAGSLDERGGYRGILKYVFHVR